MKVEQVEHAVEELDQLILRRFGTVKPAQKATNVTNPREDNTHSDFSHLRWCLVNISEFMDAGKTEKAMRWLGFVQGALWMTGLASVDELKNMNKPIPKYVLKDPGQEMTPVQALTFINTLQQYMFEVGDRDRQIDPDKEISGADLVETVTSMLNVYGLTPQLDDEPRKAEEPSPCGSKDWAGAQAASANRISELEDTLSYSQVEVAKFKRALTNENFAHREAFQRAMKAEERVRNLERQLSDSMNLNEYQKAVREFRLVMQVPGDETLVKYGQRLQDECARLKLSARGFETSLKMCQREREGFESQTQSLRNECDKLEKKLVATLNELKLERLGHEGARKRLEVELNTKKAFERKPAKRRKKR